MMDRLTTIFFGVLMAILFAILVAICVSIVLDDEDSGGSSEVFNTNAEGAEIIEMPSGIYNAATKCDHGNRIYVTENGGIWGVEQDPTCQE